MDMVDSGLTVKQRSLWREYEFISEAVRQSIVPPLSLRHVMNKWFEIKYILAEPPRRRVNQLLSLCLTGGFT